VASVPFVAPRALYGFTGAWVAYQQSVLVRGGRRWWGVLLAGVVWDINAFVSI
jgi:hypothetical protein